jgi:hypothetical protein
MDERQGWWVVDGPGNNANFHHAIRFSYESFCMYPIALDRIPNNFFMGSQKFYRIISPYSELQCSLNSKVDENPSDNF